MFIKHESIQHKTGAVSEADARLGDFAVWPRTASGERSVGSRDGKTPMVSVGALRKRSDRARTTLSLALFHVQPETARVFNRLARSGEVSLSRYDLTRFSRKDWDSRRRFDAIIVERGTTTPAEPNLLKWLRKLVPEVPLLAYGGPAQTKRRSVFAMHLTEVPSSKGLRSLVADARRHHETAKSATRAAIRLRETTRRLQVLGDIVATANSSLEPRNVLSVIMSRIQQLIPSEAWSILLVNEETNELTFEMALGEKGADFGDTRLKIGEGIAGWVAMTGQPAIVNDVSRDARFEKRFDDFTRFHTRSVLCAPLESRGKTIGVVEILNREAGNRFTQRDLKLLLTLVEPAAIALENAILFQKAERLAVTDDLTKLYNSRYLNSYLTKEIARASRHGSSLSLIFLDLDGFKSVNDHHGHLCGSRTLFQVGAIIKHSVREEDVVSRYGGDEFVVVLPETNGPGACRVAERIRQALRQHPFLTEHGVTYRLTASLGVGSFPEHGTAPQDLIQKADQAMYIVKESGKDAVALAC